MVRRAEVFRTKQGINLLTGHRVTALDPENRRVAGTTLAGKAFEQTYDRLLIATGATAVMPEVPGIDLPGVTALKTLEDGRRVKQLLKAAAVRDVIVIGMGYVAMEMVEALSALGVRATMVKPNPVFLPWLAPELAEPLKA